VNAAFYSKKMKGQGSVWAFGEVKEGSGWEALPDDSRVWLHVSNRPLSDEECETLATSLNEFLGHWSAHGQALKSSWRLEGRRALVVGLDEGSAGATGCSIDKLVHHLQGFSGSGLDTPLNWFSRDLVIHYYITANDPAESEWKESSLAGYWALRKAHQIADDSLVVNSVVSTKAQCLPSLVKAFASTWHTEMWR
jgi:hypothetical protein